MPKPKMPDVDWDAQPLGKVEDGELAQRLGVELPAVDEARRVRGICDFETRRKVRGRRAAELHWDQQPLGKMTDRQLGDTLGISQHAVYLQRKKRGIKAHGNPSKVDWDAQPLGEVPDTKIADACNVSRERVRQIREKRGIISYTERVRAENFKVLETMGNLERLTIAEIIINSGVTRNHVLRFCAEHKIKTVGPGPRIDWSTYDFIGKSDAEIGQEFGIAHECVARHRRKHGIPAQRKSRPGIILQKRIDWNRQPLGKIPDQALSILLGVSRGAVISARKRRGIPSFTEQKDKKK